MKTSNTKAFVETEQYGGKKKMPVNKKKMKAMKEQYGKEKGKDVYFATEMKAKQKAKGKKKK